MAEPYIAEIRIWANSYAPYGWAYCKGDTLAISEYTAVYSLLGTYFGGDGRTSFMLPNLIGKTVAHCGQGAGSSTLNRPFSFGFGQANVTLDASMIPSHTHMAYGITEIAKKNIASDSMYFAAAYDTSAKSVCYTYHEADTTGATTTLMDKNAMSTSGGGGSHKNIQPVLAVNYCIAMMGVYPSRP